MDDLDDDPLSSFTKSKSLNETVHSIQQDLSTIDHAYGSMKSNFHSPDVKKLKYKIKSLKSERDENSKQSIIENEQNLETAYRQYERNVQFIRTRHQENIQILQNKHEEELEKTINRYEEQLVSIRRQVQDLPGLRVTLQNKDDEILALQEEIRNNKKNYEDKVAKLIQDLEEEKNEEQTEKGDLKKYVDIFKKRCLVLETMLKNVQRTNSDLKEKLKETNKNCDIKIAKARIDYEGRQRSIEGDLHKMEQELEKERLQSTRKMNNASQQIEQERVTYEAKIMMLNDEIEDQKKTRKYLEHKTKELEEKIGVFRDAVTKIKEQYEITSKEVKFETDLKNQAHKEEIERLAHQLEEVKLRSERKQTEERMQANAKIEELTKILKEQKWINVKPIMSSHQVQTDPSGFEAKTVHEFTIHLEQLEEKYKKEKSEYENTIARLTDEMDEQKECFTKIIELKQQLEVTSINLETSSESNKKYFKEFIKLKKDFDTSKKHYEIQLRKHHQEIQKYQNMNKDLATKFEKLKKDYDQQGKSFNNLQKNYQILEEANDGMKAKFGETTKAIDAHMDVLKLTIDDNKTFYVDTVLNLKHQIEDLIKQQVALEAKAKKDIRDAVEAERARQNETFAKIEEERAKFNKELQEQNQTIAKLNKDLENQLEEVNKMKNDHIQGITKLRQHYEKEMQHTDDLIVILTNDLEHNTKKYNKLKQIKAKTISETKSQITNIQRNYEETIRSLEKQLESSNQLLETTNSNLRKEIEQFLLNKELLEKSKVHVEAENEQCQVKIENLTKYCEKLKSDMENLVRQYQDSLKEKTFLEEKEKSELQASVAQLKATIESNKREYEEYVLKLKGDIKKGKLYIEQLIEIKVNLENKLKGCEKKEATLQKFVGESFLKCSTKLEQELADDVATFTKV